MSRTYKDRPTRVRFPDQHWKTSGEYESVSYIQVRKSHYSDALIEQLAWYSIKRPYIKLKKPRCHDTEWHWLGSTPSWWTNMFMNRPQRIASNQYMRQLSLDIDLYEVDPPPIGRKPHIYYW